MRAIVPGHHDCGAVEARDDAEIRLGHRAILGGVYIFFLGGILIHGIVIWDDAWERVGAVAASLITVVMTAAMMRRGAFESRLSLEVRSDRTANGRTHFRMASAGQAMSSDVSLEYPDGTRQLRAADAEIPRFSSLRRAGFRPSSGEEAFVREIKVSTRVVGKDGHDEALGAVVEIQDGDVRKFDLRLEGGEIVVPIGRREWEITLLFPDDDRRMRSEE